MIATIAGIVRRIGEDSLVIEVGGIGLLVHVPSPVLANVQVGRSALLHTHLHVREASLALYGFSAEADLDLFRLLLNVSGVGPRLALAVISTVSPELLTGAVARDEPEVLQRVPGIGKKTAERILFQLRDKLPADRLPAGMTGLTDVDAEVIAALTALGYSVVEAQAAIQRLPRDSVLNLEDRVRAALSGLAS